MTFHGNLTMVDCPICGRRISKTNFSKHSDACHGLDKNELSSLAWERAAFVLKVCKCPTISGRFRSAAQEAAINKHIDKVIVPFLEKKANDIQSRRRKG